MKGDATPRFLCAIVRQTVCRYTRKYTRQIHTRNANRLIRRGRTAGNRA
jgi:hypothetical protein